jgi:hypothetical protein
MSMNNTIKIAVGKTQVAQSKRAVSISKSGKPGMYDSVQWTTSDAGTFTINFGATKSPFKASTCDVSEDSPGALELKAHPSLHTAFKYDIKDSDGNTWDDPFIIIED